MSGLDIANIIVSFVMLIIIIVAIIKKIDINFALLTTSILGIIYFTVVNGQSIMGTGTIGSKILDIVNYVKSIFTTQMADQILMLMTVIGYVTYMNHLKATNLLCLLVGKPLKKMRNPFVVVAGTIVFTAFLKWAIQSNLGQAALILATIYPIMLSLGVTRATAASAIMFAGGIMWGPGNGLTVMLWGMAPSSMPIADYFAKYELINTFISMAIAITAFYFTSKYYDKKENAQAETQWQSVQDPKELGLPMWYCVLPFLPVILILIFSSLIVKTIIIPIATANIVSWILVFCIEILRKKNKLEAINDTAQFWKGCADMMLLSGGLLVTANVFAGILNKIGGISTLFKLLIPSNGSSGLTLLIIVGAIGAFIFTIVGGTVVGMTSLFGAIFASIIQPLGVSMHLVAKTLLPAGCISCSMAPISAGNLFVAQQTNVEIITLIKRCSIPAVAYAITSIIVTQFILVG